MSGVPVSTLSRGHRRMDPAGSLCPRRLTTYSKSQMLSPYIIRHAYGLGEGLISCLEMRKLLKWFGTLERLLGVLILFQNKHNSCWVCKFVKKKPVTPQATNIRIYTAPRLLWTYGTFTPTQLLDSHYIWTKPLSQRKVYEVWTQLLCISLLGFLVCLLFLFPSFFII